MLIVESGATFGTVSGGCLEADVLERAKKVLKTDQPEVFVYDTISVEDSIFSLNMGCRGVIRILLEPLGAENPLMQILQTTAESRESLVVATLIQTENHEKSIIGGKVFLTADNKFRFDNLPDADGLRQNLTDDLTAFARQTEAAQIKFYETADNRFEFFVETINPPIALNIFGAGADAAPLARFAKNLGWTATIVDHRAAVATIERFPDADAIIIARPETLGENLLSAGQPSARQSEQQSAAVIMTHNYERDREILRRVLKRDFAYIGALGPKRRTEQLLRELKDDGEIFNEKQLAKLFAPIGLDIGAATPEAIALAIVAEIQAVLSHRTGGFLRSRTGSIYGRSEIA